MRSVLAVAVIAAAPGLAGPAEDRDFFESKVRPVLAKNCFACHTASKLGGLEMASRDALVKGGNSGPAVVPGQPEQSLLIRAVRHEHERIKMPPTGDRLTGTEIDDLAAWVKNGAFWPTEGPREVRPPIVTPERRAFWSFRPVQKAAPPSVRDKAWARSAIDAYILSALESKGLKPAPPADRRSLIRRASYDLTGLPPSAGEVDAFLADRSPNAFAKVIDRLLASPHYGEHWGRHWLDVARYSDDKLDPTGETPLKNSYRYRDWVISAFNQDIPYDTFIKAQIAGDVMGRPELEPALGLYGLSPEFQDDRVDVTTRGFMGLTVACAQCHDHKFDPIPTADYYSLLGVFNSTEYFERPVAPAAEVNEYKKRKKLADDQQALIKEFVESQGLQLAEIFAAKAADYLMATIEHDENLDCDTIQALKKYLGKTPRDHPFLSDWDSAVKRGAVPADLRVIAQAFQQKLIAVHRDKKAIDEKNKITLGGSNERRNLANANLASLPRDDYFLWRDFYAVNRGVFLYGDKKIDRFLHGEWKTHLDSMRARFAELEKAVPPMYAFVHGIRDKTKPADEQIHIRGDRNNKGDVAPRRFLSVLCENEPKRFTKGSGRLELGEAIADPRNPLTARVIVNRIWQWHFGDGIVRTPSNFGQLGERPSHPELLDHLAARFIENKWSIKAMHREIMLTSTYGMSGHYSAKASEVDPDNRLLWHFPQRRLSAESLRDSLLAVSGLLERKVGGPAARLTDDNLRRTVYGYVSRKKLDPMLSVFDFPNPNNTTEARIATDVPLQRLFLLNSGLMEKAAEAAVKRIEAETDARRRIEAAYRLVFARKPSAAELKLGMAYVERDTWPRYVQVLMSSNEFLHP